MTIRHDLSCIRVRTDTYEALKRDAEKNGMKLWAAADEAINTYLLMNEQRRL